jgi:hypothetical protein
MATAVAIAIRKAEALDRLEAALTDAADRLGGDLPERPTQIHPDLRETVTLEWIAEAVEALGAEPDAEAAEAETESEPEPKAKPAKKSKAS